MHVHGRRVLQNKSGFAETFVARRVEQRAILLESLQQYKGCYCNIHCIAVVMKKNSGIPARRESSIALTLSLAS